MVELDRLACSLSSPLGLASLAANCVAWILEMSANFEFKLVLTFIRFLGLAFSNWTSKNCIR